MNRKAITCKSRRPGWPAATRWGWGFDPWVPSIPGDAEGLLPFRAWLANVATGQLERVEQWKAIQLRASLN